jgi:hypothetical protein
MLRSCCASTRSVRALAAAVAIGAPLALAQTAAADHDFGRGYNLVDRGSIGTFRLDGRTFCITSERAAASQIAGAFCRLGYTAWTDCDSVVVRAGRGCEPSFRWDGCDYQLCDSYRGDCLVLSLRPLAHRPIVRTRIIRTQTCAPTPICISRGGEQSGGICRDDWSARRHTGVITIRGGRGHFRRDDPDWGRRVGDDFRSRSLDQGFGRRWNDTHDSGFVGWNWTSRKR